jgi:endonuclease III
MNTKKSTPLIKDLPEETRIQMLIGGMMEYSKYVYDYSKPAKKKNFTSMQANDFLLGCVFDRGVKWELAWDAGKYLNKDLGDKNDPEKVWREIIKMKGKKLADYMLTGNKGKAFHRFWRTYARLLPDTAKHMLDYYNGDARMIWKDQGNPRVIEKRFDDIPTIGPAIAKMAVIILIKDYGQLQDKEQYKNLDVKPDVHVTRVFKRAGLVPRDANMEAVVEAARKYSPEDPSLLDTAAWNIGLKWCHATKPNCRNCVISALCLKEKIR